MGTVLKLSIRSPRPPGGGGQGPTVTAALRAEIEAGASAALDLADYLIEILDQIDGDLDFEDGADVEPSLGAPERQEHQITWLRGGDRDLELDQLDGGGQ